MIMNASFIAAAIVAALSVPIASAQDKPAPAKPAMNMDMGKSATGSAAPTMPAMNVEADKQSAQTQANMEKMQQQMDKIATTTDPKERQKLMQGHMQTMQENMKAMRDMGSPKMKGGGEHGAMGMGMGNKGSMPNSDMQKRQDMSDKRMDMMQEMMNQMMQRDKAMKPMGDM